MNFIKTVLLWWLMPGILLADTYHLEISRNKVIIDGEPIEKITVNGTIPGPTLNWRQGEDVTVKVTNSLDEDTSIHWHGILLPGEMDGVPGLNGFPGIRPGETFTYTFTIRQSGTYWYHAHSNAQEQDGLYGALVVTPAEPESVQPDRDYVVLLSDFSQESGNQIFSHLKMDSEYYQFSRRTVSDFLRDIREFGFKAAGKNANNWGMMRMRSSDLADVTGYRFLINGKTPDQNWTGLFSPGEKIRLRIINASAMSIYDVRIPDIKMTVVASDGQDVEPVKIDEFRIGVAETYDVMIIPESDMAYTLVAEPIDRSGFALGTLAPRQGMKGPAPEQRPRTLLTMADMGMSHDMDHSKMDHGKMTSGEIELMHANMRSGWADTGAPSGHRLLQYSDLRFRNHQPNTNSPERTIDMRLGGFMERYIWTLNGKKHVQAEKLKLRYGERVRINYINETMMAHPMHLHGMFTQLDNGQPPDKMPNKHTVIVPPGETASVILTADEPGEWAFHCHLLYHMLSGMMTTAVVLPPDSRNSAPLNLGEAAGSEDGAFRNSGKVVGMAEHAHGDELIHRFVLETDYKLDAAEDLLAWDLDGWIGNDDHKLWLRSEGESERDELKHNEAWMLYSRRCSTFWDLQAGYRYDDKPFNRSFLVIGLNGLAPYFFETGVHLFVDEEKNVSARIKQEYEMLLTQRCILDAYYEAYVSADKSPELHLDSGVTSADVGVQLRYEITRKIAPFIDLSHERLFGGTASIARVNGEDVKSTSVRLGLRLML
jgi:FtsP/CotA-like multicopper oxidase with cupredoxin domain